MINNAILGVISGARNPISILSPDWPTLALWYTFNANAGGYFIDQSPNGRDGEITGTAVVTGLEGNAVSFSANSASSSIASNWVEISGSGYELVGNFSTSFWFRDTVAKPYNVFIGSNPGGTLQDSISIRIASGAFQLEIASGYPSGSIGSLTLGAYDTNWHHVATSFDLGTGLAKIYYDSTYIGEYAVQAGFLAQWLACYRRASSSSANSRQTYEQLRIFEQTLSPAQVALLYGEL
jgi:hypothetical protein